MKAVFGVCAGRAAASAARSSIDSCPKLQVVFGCQKRRRPTSERMETMEPAMSTREGAEKVC